MPGFPSRFADIEVLAPGADQLTGLTTSEILPPMAGTQNTAVVDTGLVEMPSSRVKTIAVVVTTSLTWVTSGQATVQLFAARTKYGVLGSTGPIGSATAVTQPITPYLGSTGAASSFPTGNVPNTCALAGAAGNLGGAAVTTLAAGIFWVGLSSMAALGDWYPVLGIEVKFPSALTAGAFFVALEVSPL
jgi:hypothetical protein